MRKAAGFHPRLNCSLDQPWVIYHEASLATTTRTRNRRPTSKYRPKDPRRMRLRDSTRPALSAAAGGGSRPLFVEEDTIYAARGTLAPDSAYQNRHRLARGSPAREVLWIWHGEGPVSPSDCSRHSWLSWYSRRDAGIPPPRLSRLLRQPTRLPSLPGPLPRSARLPSS